MCGATNSGRRPAGAGYAARMHPELVTARADHEAATEGWRALVRAMSDEQANWRPGPERWSVAQCLDHVCIVTGAVMPGLEAIVEDARARGLTAPGPFRYGWIGRWFLAAQPSDAGRRTRTPGTYRPSASSIDLAAVTARFESVQARFGRVVAAADGLDLARLRVPSPALALLRFPVGIWFRALPQHTLRHLAQAWRVREDARFPPA